MDEESAVELRRRLADLRVAHRDLDDVLARLASQSPVDQLMLGRLKKRKLVLKDQITMLESALVPNIIA